MYADSQPARQQAVGPQNDTEIAASQSFSLAIYRVILPGFGEQHGLWQLQVAHTFAGSLITHAHFTRPSSNCQFFTSLCAPAVNDGSTCFCTHPHSEAMSPMPLQVAGLECSFTHVCCPFCTDFFAVPSETAPNKSFSCCRFSIMPTSARLPADARFTTRSPSLDPSHHY